MSKLVGVQLYSLRKELAQDFVAIIQELAAIGFPIVEGWEDMPLAHDRIAELLNAHDLKMLSCHLPLPLGEKKGDVMQAIEAYDLKYAIVPWLPPENFTTVDGVQRICERLNQANELFKNNDVAFGYHNHDFEFVDVNGRTAFEIMIEELDPTIILEIDTYWVQLAGHNPSDLVQRLGNRSPLIHIKDGEANKEMRDKPMVALGNGNVDIESIIAAGGENTLALIVELDSCATDMMTAIRGSYQYLSDRGLVAGKI